MGVSARAVFWRPAGAPTDATEKHTGMLAWDSDTGHSIWSPMPRSGAQGMQVQCSGHAVCSVQVQCSGAVFRCSVQVQCSGAVFRCSVQVQCSGAQGMQVQCSGGRPRPCGRPCSVHVDGRSPGWPCSAQADDHALGWPCCAQVSWVSTSTGQALAFLLGRYLFRPTVKVRAAVCGCWEACSA